MTDFHMKYNSGLKWVNKLLLSQISQMWSRLPNKNLEVKRLKSAASKNVQVKSLKTNHLCM